jgi:hypothetical protein
MVIPAIVPSRLKKVLETRDVCNNTKMPSTLSQTLNVEWLTSLLKGHYLKKHILWAERVFLTLLIEKK